MSKEEKKLDSVDNASGSKNADEHLDQERARSIVEAIMSDTEYGKALEERRKIDVMIMLGEVLFFIILCFLFLGVIALTFMKL